MEIANRIKGLEYIKGSQLRPHPKNPRRHPDGQIKALEGALAQIGIADALIVYRAEDGVMTTIDGHCRGEHWAEVEWPCLVLDVTDEEAEFILATLDPLSGLATIDDETMQRLLESVDFECADLLEALIAPGPVEVREDPPAPAFKEYNEDIETDHRCPKCGYVWSGGD